DVHRAGHLLLKEIAAVREDGRDAGADVLAAHDGGVADANAVHVGDGVERPGWQRADGHAEVAQARAVLGLDRAGQEEKGEDDALHAAMPRYPKNSRTISSSSPSGASMS